MLINHFPIPTHRSPHVKTGNSSLVSILGKEASDLFKLELMVLQGTFAQLGLANKPVMISEYKRSNFAAQRQSPFESGCMQPARLEWHSCCIRHVTGDARFHWDDAEATQIYKNTFGLTLLWAERLGIAAANGIQAVFQPNLLPLHERGVRLQPSPVIYFFLR